MLRTLFSLLLVSTWVGLSTAADVQPLPRDVGGIKLGAEVSAAETKFGKLQCHDSKEGFRVCRWAAGVALPVEEFEVFVSEGSIVSLVYAEKKPDSPWEFLDSLIDRFGRPSLSGLREKDRDGRTHEVFGWKDESTLYSIRLVWSESSELAAVMSTLWDRDAYKAWEAKMTKPTATTEPAR